MLREASLLRLFLRLVAVATLIVAPMACGSSSSGSGAPADSGTGTTGPTCLDANGQPTKSCAVTPAADTCALGDANHCVPLEKLVVLADNGQSGPCIHLVYQNECSKEIYADTCIEHTGTGSGSSWQCWTSSVLPHATIDVSQCQATGKYFFVSSTSSGQLDIDEQQCPAPM